MKQKAIDFDELYGDLIQVQERTTAPSAVEWRPGERDHFVSLLENSFGNCTEAGKFQLRKEFDPETAKEVSLKLKTAANLLELPDRMGISVTQRKRRNSELNRIFCELKYMGQHASRKDAIKAVIGALKGAKENVSKTEISVSTDIRKTSLSPVMTEMLRAGVLVSEGKMANMTYALAADWRTKLKAMMAASKPAPDPEPEPEPPIEEPDPVEDTEEELDIDGEERDDEGDEDDIDLDEMW